MPPAKTECGPVLPQCATFQGRTEAQVNDMCDRLDRGETKFDRLSDAIDRLTDGVAKLNLAMAKLPDATKTEERISRLERAGIYARGYSRGMIFVASIVGGAITAVGIPLVSSLVKWVRS